MQRVSNCILRKNDQVLLLKKPSRGWWVAPGGKMELRESILESAVREYKEETGISLNNPRLKGIFTFVIENKGSVVKEWMMFTFKATEFSGDLLEQSPEGDLAWVPVNAIPNLPMAGGDYMIFDHVLNKDSLIYGTFTYNENMDLLSSNLEAEGELIKKTKG
ncbi:NUDIX hydrolase [Salipaludibacillus aurantiacus]|uniref:8-oxo-dGTP diphosphatase n=1 Tax=Salipaludibacillus aurantiacus TaxID=1601833 RepID=A0A1H9X810_9BACI|nr:8-oxo-dGTP diphosphatase [Salipaludibacillus aurantiacus]SES41783.1 8-oxo-dGTP diphosphatase [Salipaludibacillus aurantiacus]